MKAVFILLFGVVFAVNANDPYEETIDQFVAEFYRDCAIRGIYMDHRTLEWKIDNIARRGRYGLSARKKDHVLVVFDRAFLQTHKRNRLLIKFLVYHELAHGILHLDHCDGVHIMNPEIFNNRKLWRQLSESMIDDMLKGDGVRKSRL